MANSLFPNYKTKKNLKLTNLFICVVLKKNYGQNILQKWLSWVFFSDILKENYFNLNKNRQFLFYTFIFKFEYFLCLRNVLFSSLLGELGSINKYVMIYWTNKIHFQYSTTLTVGPWISQFSFHRLHKHHNHAFSFRSYSVEVAKDDSFKYTKAMRLAFVKYHCFILKFK